MRSPFPKVKLALHSCRRHIPPIGRRVLCRPAMQAGFPIRLRELQYIARPGGYDAALRSGLFTLVSVLSLLLCMATVVVWVRSYWVSDRFTAHWLNRDSGDGIIFNNLAVLSESGGLVVDRSDQTTPHGFSPGLIARWREHGHLYLDHPSPPGSIIRMGPRWINSLWMFQFSRSANSSARLNESRCVLPLWPLALLLAIGPAILVRRSFTNARQQRRRMRRECPACGYSLIRNTTGICPECGRETSKSASHVAMIFSAIVAISPLEFH